MTGHGSPVAGSAAPPVRLGTRIRRRVRGQAAPEPETPILPATHTACMAPQAALYFLTNGDVRTCCMNVDHPLGNITRQRLPEIWAGQRRADLVDHLRARNFSLGCHPCDWQFHNESDTKVYAHAFDNLVPVVEERGDDWPLHLEFNLSNSCNLQCIQCHGELSSSIRIHREHLPAMPRVYDDEFFEDLVPFLQHALEIQVAGGEPFLGTETATLWDLIATHAPDASCSVVTNGTQWNKRVQRIIETVPMSITISIDGISKEVYEPIRVGSNFDEVLVNIDHFLEYTRQMGTYLTFNHCLMVQNYHEFADLLLFAEERGIDVNVSVVYHPPECSLSGLDADGLREVCELLEAQSVDLLPKLRRNAGVWTTELARLRQWQQFRQESPVSTPLMNISSAPKFILGLRQKGEGPVDPQPIIDALAGEGDERRPVHEIRIGRGDRITSSGAGAAEALGLAEDALLGATAEELQALLVDRYGDVAGFEVLEEDGDHVDQIVTYGTVPFRSITLAARDARGWVDEVRLLFTSPD